jgi:hypothetical protein
MYSLNVIGMLSAFCWEAQRKKVQKTWRVITQQSRSFELCVLASEILIHRKVALEVGMKLGTTAVCQLADALSVRARTQWRKRDCLPACPCSPRYHLQWNPLTRAYLSSCWPDRRVGREKNASQLLSCRQMFRALRCLIHELYGNRRYQAPPIQWTLDNFNARHILVTHFSKIAFQILSSRWSVAALQDPSPPRNPRDFPNDPVWPVWIKILVIV